MGRMPAAGGVWTALGLWRGVMEVSVVGIGSVNLPNKKKKKEHFGLCVNDGKYYKSVVEPLKCLPGLRLALFCCCCFTRFDRLREFQRKSRILHYREKAKNSNFYNPHNVTNARRSTFMIGRFLFQPAGWTVREGANS